MGKSSSRRCRPIWVGARPFVFFDKEALVDSYFRLFDELYDTYNDKDTRILLAPCWAHGASEAFCAVCAPKRTSAAV